MAAGIEADIFRPDDELRRLAKRAIELGVDGEFRQGARPDDVIKSLSHEVSLAARGLRSWWSRATLVQHQRGRRLHHYHRSE
jgi:pyruvate,water dikinase